MAITVLCVLTVAALGVEPVWVQTVETGPDARQPQLAVAADGAVLLAYGVGDTIYCTTSSDGGKTFGVPVEVARSGIMAMGMRRGPRIAATDKAVVVTAVCGEKGGGKDGDVVAWRSADRGKSWTGPVAVNTIRGSAREGLHGMAAGPNGSVYCVWLDLRLKRTQVYGALSTDGGATWKDEKLIYESPDGKVCECCHPSAAYDPDGGLHVLWRNQLQGNRDLYLATSKDDGKTFAPAAKVGQGTWRLDVCPMDGGGVAGLAKGAVATVWRRDRTVYRCLAGGAEVALGPGEQPWAAAGASGAYYVWLEARPGAVKAVTPGSDKPIELDREAVDPVVASAVQGKGPVVAAWEAGKGPAHRIRVAVLSATP